MPLSYQKDAWVIGISQQGLPVVGMPRLRYTWFIDVSSALRHAVPQNVWQMAVGASKHWWLQWHACRTPVRQLHPSFTVQLAMKRLAVSADTKVH